MSLAEAVPARRMEQDDAVAEVLRKLAVVWTGFEGRLEATPLIRKLTRGRFELADYHAFRSTCANKSKTAHSGCRAPPPASARSTWSCAPR
jgi:hypothetical protein